MIIWLVITYYLRSNTDLFHSETVCQIFCYAWKTGQNSSKTNVVDSMCQLFAIDAKLYRNVTSPEDNRKLQDDLDRIYEWSTRWQLPFNIDKCKSFHIGRKNNRYWYEMNGTKLKQVTEEKDLGIFIDDELKFHKQCASATKKANAILGLLKKSFTLLDKKTLPLLYKSLIRPHLEYGNVVWGPHYAEDIKSIGKVHRRATKLVPELKNLSYEERLRELHLPSLAHRRRRGDMIVTYRLMTGQMNINKDNFLKISSLTTRGHQFKITKSTQVNYRESTLFRRESLRIGTRYHQR